MVCGRPSSVRMKSSLVRPFTIFPCLSRTVASTFTTFTWTERVVIGRSAAVSVDGLAVEFFFACASLPDCAIATLSARAIIKHARDRKRDFTGWAFPGRIRRSADISRNSLLRIGENARKQQLVVSFTVKVCKDVL